MSKGNQRGPFADFGFGSQFLTSTTDKQSLIPLLSKGKGRRSSNKLNINRVKQNILPRATSRLCYSQCQPSRTEVSGWDQLHELYAGKVLNLCGAEGERDGTTTQIPL